MSVSSFQTANLPDGRKLSYELSGPSNAPIILLSNSLLANFTAWDPLVQFLHASGFRALRYDNPGHGASSVPADPNSVTFHTLSTDVEALLRALNIKELYAWIGVSMGASVGVIFAVQNPGVVKKLVICDTIRCAPVVSGAEDAFGPRVELAQTKEDAIATLTEQTLARWFREGWRDSHPEETERMRRLLNTTRREGFIACCHALRDNSYDLSPYLGRIGSSVDEAMLVVGEFDANLPEIMGQMRGEVQTGFGTRSVVQWAVIKGSGHLPMIDNPQQYNAEVLRFLKG